MKKKAKDPRRRILYTRLTQIEYDNLVAASKKTTFLKLSEYARALLTNKPVTNLYRNESADDFLLIAIGLKNDLQALSKTLNQSVERLRQLNGKTEMNFAIENLDAIAFSIQQKIEEIMTVMHKIYNQWLQK